VAVPGLSQAGSGLLTGVVAPPGGLVPIDVRLDLSRPHAECSCVAGQLGDLSGVGVERVAVLGERGPELRVGHHGRVPDPVDGLQAVAYADGVKPSPLASREDPRVDLEVQVSVGIAGPRREVAYDGGLDLLDRHLYLPPSRPDPRRRMGGEPAGDLLGCGHLGAAVRLGDLGVKYGGERPGLRPVDGDLDEPHRLVVGPQPPLGRAGLDVVAGDPLLVGLAVEVGSALQVDGVGRGVAAGDEPHRQPAALGKVVVVGPRPVGLDVVARGSGGAAVDLHPAVHPNRLRQQPSTTTYPQLSAHISGRWVTYFRSMRAAGKGG
jgi:hypothetical protein